MRNGFRSVIFDFDYTLADSSRGIAECVNYALRCLGRPAVSYDAACQTIGLSLLDTFRELTGEVHPGQGDEFGRLFIEEADRVMTKMTVLYEAVSPTMKRLRQHGLALGIVSTKFRYRIEGILERDGLLNSFDVIVGGEDVSKHKPSPEGLLMAIARLNCPASRTLYVGDSLVDAETARRAEVPFVAVLSGVTPRSAFAGHEVAAVLEDLGQLPAWLRE